MPEPAEIRLARSHRAYLVAPAGYGKTELIAKAIAHSGNIRQLVLTHTHAGVHALRNRLRRLGVPSKSFHLDTIAGWALTYVQSYPTLSQLEISFPPRDEDWSKVYEALTRLLTYTPIRKVVQASYGGLYVDEYQDCTLTQHNMVLCLSDILDCRFVGDPLQGIFDFAGPLVDWRLHIPSDFERLPDLTTPWRWQTIDPQFAVWLALARASILNGTELNLRPTNCGRVNWVQKQENAQWVTCMGAAGRAGSIVAIHRMPHNAHGLSRNLRGAFTSMEEIYSKDLFQWAQKLDSTQGAQRALVLMEFASECMTTVTTEMRTIRTAFERGRPRRSRKYPALAIALERIATSPELNALIQAMRLIEIIPTAVLYRRELWREMIKAVNECLVGNHPSIYVASWNVRSRTSQLGRRIERRIVSRTPLIKGLEFDHSIVLDADALNAKELYVAMTRGTNSLTVISDSPTIQKPAPLVLQ